MKVVLYGATGKAGSVILNELVDRGHTVVAAARTPEKVQKLKNVSTVQDDLSDPAKITSIVKGVDAVVSAYGPPPDDTSQIIGATDRLVKGVEQAGGSRLIVVGGAGQPLRRTGRHGARVRTRSQGMDPNSGRAHPGVKEPETEQHRLDLFQPRWIL